MSIFQQKQLANIDRGSQSLQIRLDSLSEKH